MIDRQVQSQGRLLIAGDRTEEISALADTLTDLGFETSGCTSGEATLEALRRGSFDALLADLATLDMNSADLLQNALKQDPNLVVIAMADSMSIGAAEDAVTAGAFEWVLKPDVRKQLLPVLGRALLLRRLRMENFQLSESVAGHEAGRLLAFALDPSEVLNELADAALRRCDADEMSVMVPTAGGNELVTVATRGDGRDHILGKRVRMGQGVAGWVASHREPVVLRGEAKDSRFTSTHPRPDIGCSVSMPMLTEGRLVGVLNVNAVGRRESIPPARVKALSILASAAASALERAWLYGKMREAEEKYRSIFENVVEGIFQMAVDGTLLAVNPSLARMSGYSSPEEMLKDVGQGRHLGPATLLPAELRRLVEEHGEMVGIESRSFRKDGSSMWIMQNARAVRDREGKLLYFAGTVEDVTERKRAEEELRQRESQLRTLVDAIDDSINVKDIGGHYLVVNDEFVLRAGRPREEILGKTVSEVKGSKAGERIAKQDRAALMSGGPVEFEDDHPERDRARSCLVRKVPLRNEAGRVVGLVTVSRDVTERKQLTEQLLRAQRLEAAGRIASQVAHDFNNLLVPLVGYPEAIKAVLPKEHEAVPYCELMLQAAKQMAEINEDLITLGRSGRVAMEQVDLNRVVSEALQVMSPLPSDLVLRLELAQGIVPVSGAPSQLLRVMANLVLNARDAMQDRGTLTIRTENCHVEGSSGRYNRVGAGEYVRITVNDTGCGIPNEIKDQVFDPFFSTKRADSRRGSGLGLSIVQTIIDDHLGYVDLESEVGVGTTFYVYLPGLPAQAQVVPVETVHSGRRTVLVVDDDSNQREVMSVLLKQLGYLVETRATGEDAIESLRASPVDLMLLDMVMPPGMDGAETYRQALEVSPGQRAILISGFADPGRVREAQGWGAGPLLQKPVTLDRLRRAIRMELDAAPPGRSMC